VLLGLPIERSTRLADQALVEARHERWSEAAARYAAAAEADPSSPLHAFNTAVAFAKAGMPGRALEWNDEALRRDPAFEKALAAEPRLRSLASANARDRDERAETSGGGGPGG
jgi:predicted Zn-dependent protease